MGSSNTKTFQSCPLTIVFERYFLRSDNAPRRTRAPLPRHRSSSFPPFDQLGPVYSVLFYMEVFPLLVLCKTTLWRLQLPTSAGIWDMKRIIALKFGGQRQERSVNEPWDCKWKRAFFGWRIFTDLFVNVKKQIFKTHNYSSIADSQYFFPIFSILKLQNYYARN